MAERHAWLEGRLALLERFTVPSVRNLSPAPDLWGVYLHPDDPPDHLARLRRVLDSAGVPVLLLPHAGQWEAPTLADGLAGLGWAPQPICTLRLDSDDLLASDMIGRLRRALEGRTITGPTALSFPWGAVLDSRAHAGTPRFHGWGYVDNPFLALAEAPADWWQLRTVLMEWHTRLMAAVDHRVWLECWHPMWCTVLHGGNLQNEGLRRQFAVPLADEAALARRFGIALPPPGVPPSGQVEGP